MEQDERGGIRAAYYRAGVVRLRRRQRLHRIFASLHVWPDEAVAGVSWMRCRTCGEARRALLGESLADPVPVPVPVEQFRLLHLPRGRMPHLPGVRAHRWAG